MGNLQGGEAKPPKNAKSPGKANRLMKRRFTRGKKDIEFTGIVPEEKGEDEMSTPDRCEDRNEGEDRSEDRSGDRSEDSGVNRVETDINNGEDSRVSVGVIPTVNSRSTLRTSSQQSKNGGDGWSGANVLNETSGESSSDSVFTDPLTPVGFAEINQCYYSEESVRDVPDNTSTPVVINSFKLNEYKVRRDTELSRKLSKLGLSKTSQISLDDSCFVSEDVFVVEMPKNSRDGDCSLETTNESGVESMDDTQEMLQTTRRSSYYRPRKIELVATRITPLDVSLLNAG